MVAIPGGREQPSPHCWMYECDWREAFNDPTQARRSNHGAPLHTSLVRPLIGSLYPPCLTFILIFLQKMDGSAVHPHSHFAGRAGAGSKFPVMTGKNGVRHVSAKPECLSEGQTGVIVLILPLDSAFRFDAFPMVTKAKLSQSDWLVRSVSLAPVWPKC